MSGTAARRLARNTQLVIAEESQLYRFADPAAGSGAVETLTDALAERAWRRFRHIEAAGGILKALASGSLQGEIAAMREARLARFADGGIEMIGVNAFVAADDAPLPATAAAGESAKGALVFERLAESVEAAA
jgi:methylmalonyl-CoA mutase